MKPNEIPLHRSYVVTSNDFISIVLTRTSAEVLQAVYRHPITDDIVLVVQTQLNGEGSRLVYFDKVFWNVTIDGHAATEGDLEDLRRKPQVSFEPEPSTRALKIAVVR